MDRKVYISNELLSLAEFIPCDNPDRYSAWKDPDTEKGYNYKCSDTYEEYCMWEMKQRFNAAIVRCADNACIGFIMVSECDPPDLAIIIYKPYRSQGYGTSAFLLGVKYCFNVLKLDSIYAGCYTDNHASLRMLEKCGFEPNPDGNIKETHFLTGEEIIQMDFIKHNK